MAVIPSDSQLREQIRLAMQDRAPRLYDRLSRENGLLETEIANRMTIAREAHAMTRDQGLTPLLENPEPDLLKQSAAINRMVQASWEQALALAIDFPTEDETDSPAP